MLSAIAPQTPLREVSNTLRAGGYGVRRPRSFVFQHLDVCHLTNLQQCLVLYATTADRIVLRCYLVDTDTSLHSLAVRDRQLFCDAQGQQTLTMVPSFSSASGA